MSFLYFQAATNHYAFSAGAFPPVLISFVNLTQTRVTQEDITSVEELPLLDWPIGMSVGALS